MKQFKLSFGPIMFSKKALGQGVQGLKIGVVTEGFNQKNSDTEVNDKVRATLDVFRYSLDIVNFAEWCGPTYVENWELMWRRYPFLCMPSDPPFSFLSCWKDLSIR